MKPDMTIAESPLLREGLHRTEQTKEMPIQITNEGSIFSLTKRRKTVEANAETTILCTFGPCTLSPNPAPGSVMPA